MQSEHHIILNKNILSARGKNACYALLFFSTFVIVIMYLLFDIHKNEINNENIKLRQFEERTRRIANNISFVLKLVKNDIVFISDNAYTISYLKFSNNKNLHQNENNFEINQSILKYIETKNKQNILIYSYEIFDNTNNRILFISKDKNQITIPSHNGNDISSPCLNANNTNEIFECDTTSSIPAITISKPIIADSQQVGTIRIRIFIPTLMDRLFRDELKEAHDFVYLLHDRCHLFSTTAKLYKLPSDYPEIPRTATRIATPRQFDDRLAHWPDDSVAMSAPITDSDFSIIALIPAETIFNSKMMPMAVLASILSLLLLLGLALAMRLNTTRAFLQAQLDDKEKSEAQLRKHMDEFNTLFNALPGFAWHNNAKGQLVTANAAACRILEQPLENLTGKTPREIFPADLADAYDRFTAPLLSGERRCIEEEVEVTWQGKTINIASHAESILADDGTVNGIIGLSTNVTQKRLTEKKLERLAALQRIILDLAITLVNHPVTEMDAAIQNALRMIGTFCNADRVYVFRYDYSMEFAINSHEWNMHDTRPNSKSRRKISHATLEALVNLHRSGKITFIRSPESLPADSTIRADMQRLGIQSFITLPIIHDSRCTGFVGFESMRKDKTWDEEEVNLLNIASQLLTNAEMRRMHELRLIEARSIAEEAYNVMERRIKDRTRELTIANQRLSTEISMRIQAIQNQQITLKAISAILIAINNDDSIAQWSHAAEHSFGLESPQAIGKTLRQLPLSWNGDIIDDAIRQCRTDKNASKISNVKFVHANGTERFLVVTVTPLLDDTASMTGCLLLGEDITEIKTLEAQLAQAARLEGLGQLAAGIAHEINTPIQYVGDSVTFLKESYENFERILEFTTTNCAQQVHNFGTPCHLTVLLKDADIDFIREEAPRTFTRIEQGLGKISSIIRAMNRFSRCDLSEKTMADINEIIENAITITQNVWKYSAEMETDFEEGKLLIPCMHGEIGQAMINIIINAAHAIEDVIKGKGKGRIHITTQKKEKCLEIRIKDTGAGIPEKIGSKIFNMFFTTKPIDRGTGQGLALAYNTIVCKHKGTLTYETQLGHGTTFIITLPLDLDTENPKRGLP